MAATTKNPVCVAEQDAEGDNAANEDLAAVLYPKIFTLARKLLSTHPCIFRLYQFIPVYFAVSFNLSRHLGAHGESTLLDWGADLCNGAAHIFLTSTVTSLKEVVAAGGGLEKLFLGVGAEPRIRQANRAILRRWSVGLITVTAIFFLQGWFFLYMVFFMVGKTSNLTGRLLTPLYVYMGILPCFPMWTMYMPVFYVWLYALQWGALFAAETIERVAELVGRANPTHRDEWHSELIPAVMVLVQQTMPDLSKGFGSALGWFTFASWLEALAFFAIFLKGRTIPALMVMLFFLFLPFAVAYTLMKTSDMCDELRDKINDRRKPYLTSSDTEMSQKAELNVAMLMRYLNNLNRQQGLGVVVWGMVIDIAMVTKIFTALISFVVTVVPIVATLHKPAEPAEGNESDFYTCGPTAEQLALFEATAALNASCTYNLTVGLGGVVGVN
jgi:hypothetical protein